MNDFATDDGWQRLVRDEVIDPGFYAVRAHDGRFVHFDNGPLAMKLQRIAVDSAYETPNGRTIFVEEKITRWPKSGRPHSNYALETESCTIPGKETPGWMRYGLADRLLYAFVFPDRVKVDVFDFQKLKAWFWPLVETFPAHVNPKKNRTRVRLVPIAQAKANVPFGSVEIWPDETSPHYAELFPTQVAAE